MPRAVWLPAPLAILKVTDRLCWLADAMGSLANRLGTKRVYTLGLLLFLVASALSAAASLLWMLIGLRA